MFRVVEVDRYVYEALQPHPLKSSGHSVRLVQSVERMVQPKPFQSAVYQGSTVSDPSAQ